MKLGLGLGLGLGIPLLITLTALGTWFYIRRRRSRDQPFDAGGTQSSRALTLDSHRDEFYPQPSSLGYISTPEEKSPMKEADGIAIAELQTDNARVEAPANAVRAELDGNALQESFTRDTKNA